MSDLAPDCRHTAALRQPTRCAKVGHRERSNQTRDCTPAIQAPIPGESSESCATNLPTMSRLRSERCRTSGAACRASVIGVSSTATWGSCGSGCAPYEYTPRGTALGSKANVPNLPHRTICEQKSGRYPFSTSWRWQLGGNFRANPLITLVKPR